MLLAGCNRAPSSARGDQEATIARHADLQRPGGRRCARGRLFGRRVRGLACSRWLQSGVSEIPSARRKEFVGPQLDSKVQKVRVGLRRLVRAHVAGDLVPADDVRRLVLHERGRGNLTGTDRLGDPLAVGPAVEQQLSDGGRVADDGLPGALARSVFCITRDTV